MSTSALIKVEGSRTVGFTLSHDGYPDSVKPYLEGIVEHARESDGSDSLRSKLLADLHAEADDPDVMLERTRPTGYADYVYEISSDGEITVENNYEE